MMRCSRVPHVCYPLYSPAFLLSSGFPLSSSSPTGSVLTDQGGLGLWHWFLVLATSSVSPIQIWSQLHVACLRGWPQARRQLHISVFPFFFFLFAPLFPGVNKKQMWRTMVGEVGEEGGGWTASQTGGREGKEGREEAGPPRGHSCASQQPQGQSSAILRIQSPGNRTGRPEEGQLEPGGGGSGNSL